MSNTSKPDRIAVETSIVNEDGSTSIEGYFLDHSGWAFDATFEPSIAWDSDVTTKYSGTRLIDVSLYLDGEYFYNCPGSDYDGHHIDLSDIHWDMIDQVDLHVGPTPAERAKENLEIESRGDSLFDAISKLVKNDFADVSPEAMKRASRSFMEDARGRVEDKRHQSLAERAAAARKEAGWER